MQDLYSNSLSKKEAEAIIEKITKYNNIENSSAIYCGQELDLTCLIEENINFRNGTPAELNYETIEAQEKAQNLYIEAQKYACNETRPRTAPSITSTGEIVANEEFYKSKNHGALSGYTIMVNAGHGGYDANGNRFDPGAVNEELGLEEWLITLEYAEELTQKLLQEGANVLLVQGEVKTLGNSIENFADNHGENDNENLKLISLHCNASENKYANGTAFYYSDINDYDYNCQDLSYSISKVAEEKDINLRKNSNQNLYVCRNANALGIENSLVELGFITNKDDAHMLVNDKNFKKDILESIVEGIKDNIA